MTSTVKAHLSGISVIVSTKDTIRYASTPRGAYVALLFRLVLQCNGKAGHPVERTQDHNYIFFRAGAAGGCWHDQDEG
jgi:hypothetical protein